MCQPVVGTMTVRLEKPGLMGVRNLTSVSPPKSVSLCTFLCMSMYIHAHVKPRMYVQDRITFVGC